MVLPAFIGKVLFVTIAGSMWVWMQGYVKTQVLVHGDGILTPKPRSMPKELTDSRFGEHRFVSVNNITMHYVSLNCDNKEDGRPMILLLHGFLDFWYIWNRQIPRLGEDYCVVAPDLRGYGNTTKPEDPALYLLPQLVQDVKELLEALNPEHARKVVLVGHDWGGMISFVFSTLHEQMIDRMVIINGMHPWAFTKQLFVSLTQLKMSWYMRPFQHQVVPEKYLIMKDLEFFDKVHKSFSPAEREASKYMFSQPRALTGALNYYRAFGKDSDQLNKFPYRAINVSTLILWGERDDFITTPVAKNNQEYLADSTVVYFPQGDHYVLRGCGSEVTDYIFEFAKDGSTAKAAQRASAGGNQPCRQATKPNSKSQEPKAVPLAPGDLVIPGLS